MNKIFFSYTELKENGWTDSLIKKFLPEPDETRRNPVFRCAAPMKLYRISRVKKIKKSAKFKKEKELISKRKEAARKAVATKYAKTLELANSIEFDVPTIDKDELLKKAIQHYELIHDCFVGSVDDEFATRISTNYLRHEWTDYDDVLETISGMVGKEKAYEIIKSKVNEAIKEKHEWLNE